MDLRQRRETTAHDPKRATLHHELGCAMTELLAKPDPSALSLDRGATILAVSTPDLLAHIPLRRRFEFWPYPIAGARDLAALSGQIEGEVTVQVAVPDPVGHLARSLAHGARPAMAELRYEAVVEALCDLAKSRRIRLVLPPTLGLSYLGGDPQSVPHAAYQYALIMARSHTMMAAWLRLLDEVSGANSAHHDPLYLVGQNWSDADMPADRPQEGAQIAALSRALDEARQRGDAASIAVLKARISAIEQLLAEARAARDAAQAEVAALRASRSFKVTAPLRAIVALSKRGVGGRV